MLETTITLAKAIKIVNAKINNEEIDGDFESALRDVLLGASLENQDCIDCKKEYKKSKEYKV